MADKLRDALMASDMLLPLTHDEAIAVNVALMNFVNEKHGGATTKRWQKDAEAVFFRLDELRGRARQERDPFRS